MVLKLLQLLALPVLAASQCADCFCGTSFLNADSTCSTPCPDSTSAKCVPPQTCFGGCKNCTNPQPPTPPCADCYCGTTFDDADHKCTNKCPDGQAGSCTVPGETCWAKATNCTNPQPPAPTPAPCADCYCGTTFDDADQKCTNKCPDGEAKSCTVPGEKCWAKATNCTNPQPPAPTPAPCADCYCGTSYQDASSKCATKCPGGDDKTCNTAAAGSKCWAKVNCTGPGPVTPTPPPPPTPPPTPPPVTTFTCDKTGAKPTCKPDPTGTSTQAACQAACK